MRQYVARPGQECKSELIAGAFPRWRQLNFRNDLLKEGFGMISSPETLYVWLARRLSARNMLNLAFSIDKQKKLHIYNQ